MQADGSQRRRAGNFGMPLWSPDGRQFLIVGFNDPRDMKLINIERSEVRHIDMNDYSVFGWPNWADADTVAAIVGSDGTGDTVALLDVSNPEKARIKQVLWKSDGDAAMKPLWPVYTPITGRCVFVGIEPRGMALYSVEKDQPRRAKRLEAGGLDRQIGGLAFSPDGLYLLFCSTRPDH
jgi:Tol biopolymer transport system component